MTAKQLALLLAVAALLERLGLPADLQMLCEQVTTARAAVETEQAG